MGIAVDHALHTKLFGLTPEPPIEIESIRTGIEFYPSACCRAGLQHLLDVEFVGIPLEQEPTGEVSEHVHVPVFGRLNKSTRIFQRIARGHMQTGHHHVEARQDRVIEI